MSAIDDPSGGKASYWLAKAATALDCAVQCCLNTVIAQQLTEMERQCDLYAKDLQRQEDLETISAVLTVDYIADAASDKINFEEIEEPLFVLAGRVAFPAEKGTKVFVEAARDYEGDLVITTWKLR